MDKEGFDSIQLGFADIAEKKLSKPEAGHLKKAGVGMKKYLKEFRLDDISSYNVGDIVYADVFAEGDKVVIENEYASAPVRVHVTELIEPTALYLASHYGVEDDEQQQADGLGIRQARFVPFALERGYGAPLLQETMVTVRKAGA